MNKPFILASASLIGTIIGAGIFGIPYVMAKSGVLTCLFYFLVLGLTVLLLHLFFGEVVLRTKGKLRLPGYVQKYLGPKAKTVIGLANIVGVIGALLAYVILAGKFSSLVLPWFSAVQWSFAVWAGLSLLVLLGIQAIASVELLMNIGLFAILLVIFGFSLSKVSAANLTLFNSNNLFLPFGVILFSLMGVSAIPEVSALLKDKKQLKKVIVLASLVTIAFSFLFGLFVSGVTGPAASQEPFQALLPFLGRKIVVIGSLFGLLAVATSFLVLANYLKNALRYDYRLPLPLAFVLASGLPFALFLLGLREFIAVIGVVGTFIGLVEGVAIVLLYWQAKRKGGQKPAYSLPVPKFLLYAIVAMFVLGALAQLLY